MKLLKFFAYSLLLGTSLACSNLPCETCIFSKNGCVFALAEEAFSGKCVTTSELNAIQHLKLKATSLFGCNLVARILKVLKKKAGVTSDSEVKPVVNQNSANDKWGKKVNSFNSTSLFLRTENVLPTSPIIRQPSFNTISTRTNVGINSSILNTPSLVTTKTFYTTTATPSTTTKIVPTTTKTFPITTSTTPATSSTLPTTTSTTTPTTTTATTPTTINIPTTVITSATTSTPVPIPITTLATPTMKIPATIPTISTTARILTPQTTKPTIMLTSKNNSTKPGRQISTSNILGQSKILTEQNATRYANSSKPIHVYDYTPTTTSSRAVRNYTFFTNAVNNDSIEKPSSTSIQPQTNSTISQVLSTANKVTTHPTSNTIPATMRTSRTTTKPYWKIRNEFRNAKCPKQKRIIFQIYDWDSRSFPLLHSINSSLVCQDNRITPSIIEQIGHEWCMQYRLSRKSWKSLDSSSRSLALLNPASEYNLTCKALRYRHNHCFKDNKDNDLSMRVYTKQAGIVSEFFESISYTLLCRSNITRQEKNREQLALSYCRAATITAENVVNIEHALDYAYMLLNPAQSYWARCYCLAYRHKNCRNKYAKQQRKI
ncbi:unnamed protein product [Orchesella dallaii]|uniref:Uncharacterized protein n=1 Tax=Orchesella dallaii TaxID=48710 RepID=A0ABP1QJU3_9HEXA